MLNVKKYTNNTLSSNTYLVWVNDEKDRLLVDREDTFPYIKKEGLNIVHIFTYIHLVHLLGVIVI